MWFFCKTFSNLSCIKAEKITFFLILLDGQFEWKNSFAIKKEVYKNKKKKGNVAGAFLLYNQGTWGLQRQGKWVRMLGEVMGAEYWGGVGLRQSGCLSRVHWPWQNLLCGDPFFSQNFPFLARPAPLPTLCKLSPSPPLLAHSPPPLCGPSHLIPFNSLPFLVGA